MYKIKETKSGDFVITKEKKILWWTKTFYLCASGGRHHRYATKEMCERAKFSNDDSLIGLKERLFFKTVEEAKTGLYTWQSARNQEAQEIERCINEHTPKDHGQEINMP